MATTQTATEEGSTYVEPFELGVRDGIEHYARQVVGTPVGRWLVVLALLLGFHDGVAYPATVEVGISVGVAFLILFLYDATRAEYRRGKEADDA